MCSILHDVRAVQGSAGTSRGGRLLAAANEQANDVFGRPVLLGMLARLQFPGWPLLPFFDFVCERGLYNDWVFFRP